MLLPKCEERDSKKSKFIKEQEASALSNSIGKTTRLSKSTLVGLLLF